MLAENSVDDIWNFQVKAVKIGIVQAPAAQPEQWHNIKYILILWADSPLSKA
jgi:hypothetical protein